MAIRNKPRPILPTAPALINAVNDVMVRNMKRQRSTILELPDLFKRAFLIHHETEILPIQEFDASLELERNE